MNSVQRIVPIFVTCVQMLARYPECDEIHFIFDSYIPKSIKNTKRNRRQDSTSIELDKIDDNADA